MTDNDFIMTGYVDLTVDDVRTIARGCGLQSPDWIFPDVQTQLNADTFGAAVASLTRRGLIRNSGGTFEIDGQIAHAVELAATPGPAIVVLGAESGEPAWSWLFAGGLATSIFTRTLGVETVRLRQVDNGSLARVILGLTRAPLTDRIAPPAVELSAAEVDQVRHVFSEMLGANADAGDIAERVRALDLHRIAEAIGDEATVNSVVFLRPGQGAVTATNVVWLASADIGLQLVEVGESTGITSVPITTEDLFHRLTSEVESLMTPVWS